MLQQGDHGGDIWPSQSDVIIAVMGATGAGKSSFINTASGSELAVGRDLLSCTTNISESKRFTVDNHSVILLDTPGFDDSTVSDTDVLQILAAFLLSMKGLKLTGIVYLHRISDFRMGGGARKNMDMFREVCGDDALANVVFATTMWDCVDRERGESRQRQLTNDSQFFQPMLHLGAQIYRYEGSVQSASEIIRLVLNKSSVVLKIQREMMEEQKAIGETGAGRVLQREYAKQVKKCEDELAELRESLDRARDEQDRQTVLELEEERRALEADLERKKHDCDRISDDLLAQTAQLQQIMHTTKRRMGQDRAFDGGPIRSDPGEGRSLAAETSERKESYKLPWITIQAAVRYLHRVFNATVRSPQDSPLESRMTRRQVLPQSITAARTPRQDQPGHRPHKDDVQYPLSD